MKDRPASLDHKRLVIHNDDETPFAFAIKLLQDALGKTPEEARVIANKAHHDGSAECGTFPPAVADAFVAEAASMAEGAGHGIAVKAEAVSPGEPSGPELKCSFCGKTKDQVRTLMAGQEACICDQCVLQSSERLRSEVSSESFRHAYQILAWHFAGLPKDQIVTSSRSFAARMRADLQVAVEARLSREPIKHVGVEEEHHSFAPVTFAVLMRDERHPSLLAPLRYQEVDIGEARPIRCLVNGLWLLREDDTAFAVILSSYQGTGLERYVNVEVAVEAGDPGVALTQRLFDELEAAVQASRSYRGKILSLEKAHAFAGTANEVTVHRLETVARQEIILPDATLELLRRNVLDFAASREGLRRLGQSTKKGLLFYGPPGTGKTHTIRYLAHELTGHTTLLVTAEQVGLLGEYFALARLLQPSIMVVEDVDLIARDRGEMDGATEEALLNKLLNEMDGLKESSDTFFILTTNRPEQLEAALASRPGRIDQAIEFPLPDLDARMKLVALYSGGLRIDADVGAQIGARTDGVSPAFIKELMRRCAQSNLADGGTGRVTMAEVDAALDEMLFTGGRLNAELLGFGQGRPPAN